MKTKATMHTNQEQLLATVRDELQRMLPCFDERRMFGGVTMMFNGNMLCCVAREGLMVRVGVDGEADALARPAARPCMGTGRKMAGFIIVDYAGLSSACDIESWLRLAHAYVRTLPAKPPKSRVKKRK